FSGQRNQNAGTLRLVSQTGQALALTLNANLLSVSGMASLNVVMANGTSDFNFQVVMRNSANEPVTIQRGEFFAVDHGGWGSSLGDRLGNRTIAALGTSTTNWHFYGFGLSSHVVVQLHATTASGKLQDLLFP